jgi:hypothetical protein
VVDLDADEDDEPEVNDCLFTEFMDRSSEHCTGYGF